MNRGTDNYFTDFRAFLSDLDGRGKLHRWRPRVNKDTELMPLMRLQYRGLTDLPAPVEEPGFSCGIRVTAPFITKDPETGMRNVGMYSGHFRGRHKLIAGIARTHHAMLYHHPAAVKRGDPLPVAIILGAL